MPPPPPPLFFFGGMFQLVRASHLQQDRARTFFIYVSSKTSGTIQYHAVTACEKRRTSLCERRWTAETGVLGGSAPNRHFRASGEGRATSNPRARFSQGSRCTMEPLLPQPSDESFGFVSSDSAAASTACSGEESLRMKAAPAASPDDSMFDDDDEPELDGSASTTSTSASRPYSPSRKARDERGPRRRRRRPRVKPLPPISTQPGSQHLASGAVCVVHVEIVCSFPYESRTNTSVWFD